jgi:hypothetical protein
MLLASGIDDPLLDRIVSDLGGDAGAVRVDDLTFERAMEHRASTLLLVEPIHRAGAPPPPVPASLGSLVAAAEAPSVSRVVVVTTRPDADADLRRLRRSGARYVIVRSPLLIEAEPLRGKRLLVPRELADMPMATPGDVAAAVLGVLRDPDVMGATIEVPPCGLAALEQAGARPRVVAPWRARLGRWLGQPVLGISGFGPRTSDLGPRTSPSAAS